MNVLITGGAGFIGSYLCERLFADGHSVTILDNLSPQIHHNWEGSFFQKKIEGKCKFIKGNVCNYDDWITALTDIEMVVHLAAETGTGQSMYEIDHYYKINVQGTAILANILVNHKHSVRKIILASSRALYGEGKYKSDTLGIQYPDMRNAEQMNKGIFDLLSHDTNAVMHLMPTDENSMLHPSSMYGLTKLAQEQLLMLLSKQLNITCIALRFQNVYGPGQSLYNPYTGLLAVFSTRIRNNNPLDIYEDGKETRDFVYIDDVIDSIKLALLSEKSTSEILNVGSGVGTSILKVAELMCSYFGKKVPIIIGGKFRVGDIRHNYANISKIQQTLGFSPKVNFETGLLNFVNWVQEQDLVEDKYEASVNEMKMKKIMN
jgi:dTDP-L-rhamnose 4-epimerase